MTARSLKNHRVTVISAFSFRDGEVWRWRAEPFPSAGDRVRLGKWHTTAREAVRLALLLGAERINGLPANAINRGYGGVLIYSRGPGADLEGRWLE